MPRTIALALSIVATPALAADPCAPDDATVTLADGATLCVHPNEAAMTGWRAPEPPGLGVLPAAATWTRDDRWPLRGDEHSAIPYGHTVDGFLTLAPGVDRTGRMDGQPFTVLLNDMVVMAPTTPSVPLPTLHRLP